MVRRRPPAARPLVGSRRAVLGACAAAVVVAWFGTGWAGSAAATQGTPSRATTGLVASSPARQTTTTAVADAEAPSSTADPAAGATDPPSTDAGTVPTVPSTTTPALEDRATESDQATSRLNRVVLGLVVLAVVIAAATVFFWLRTRPGRGAASSGRSVGHVRSGAILIGADGSEQALVDPGPAALAPDDWVVQPPPTLPGASGTGSAPGGSPRPVLSDLAPAELSATERPELSATESPELPATERTAADPVPASSGGTWWASQAGEQGATPARADGVPSSD